MRDDSFCLGAKILKFSRRTPKANARAILKVMPTERTRARLRKLLAPCCLDCNGSNDVTPAGFDPLRPTMLTALPPEIFEKICAHLKPRDVVTLSTCSHAACSLARSSRLPWKQLDVFLHNPHRHIVGTKRITKAWPNVRFVFRMNERDPATNAAVMFGRSELIKWLSLAEPNCVRGVDFSHNLIEPSLVRGDGDPLWVEAMSMIKLGIFASNTHIANLSPFSNMMLRGNQFGLRDTYHKHRHLIVRHFAPCCQISRLIYQLDVPQS
eukprot:TRINITY_DN9924_c0_g4_i1.p1 TRINITY_DN9924_c0_g4~~TRINITY_DN9924_c0_g4_i1.p1  ORF type:complete len:267 (+),score=21.92 TRINITY_DN9924_c0_g4_i1:124-924(+)